MRRREMNRSSRRDREESGSRRSRFKYHRRSASDIEKRASQRGGSYESYLREDIKMYKVKNGQQTVRFLPPPEEDYEHYAIDVYLHYQVGIDQQTIVCPRKMASENCPICEEYEAEMSESNDDLSDKEKEEINQLQPGKRVLGYIIDRDEENEGVQAWGQPWTLDRDIGKQMIDSRTGEILYIDDPEEGYDVTFDKEGQGRRTKYTGIKIARRSSALARNEKKIDEYLDFAVNNPLKSIPIIKDYDDIKAIFHAKDTKDGDRNDGRDRDNRRDKKDEEETPFTSAEILRMSVEDLEEVIEDENLNIDDSVDENDLAEAVCEALGLSRSRESTRRSGSGRDKARDLRRRGESRRSGRRRELDPDEDVD